MKILIYILIIVFSIYFLMCVMLYVFQDKLIFFPPVPEADLYNSFKQNEISLVSQGKTIAGWKINRESDASKTIIYFGGNAEEVAYLNYEANALKVRQVIAFNHPGYGKSEGRPSQQSLYQNALDVYDYTLKEYKIKPGDIIVIGRSLGSSAAAYLAANREIAGLVLITPFDSIESIAAQRFKYFPIKLILKHSFYTIESIKRVDKRVLILAAEQDEMISDISLNKLGQALGDNSKMVKYSGVGHNTIQTHPAYYDELNRFFDKE